MRVSTCAGNVKKVEKYSLDSGGGGHRNSRQVEAGGALLDQGQAEKNRADRRDREADRHGSQRTEKPVRDTVRSRGGHGGPASEIPRGAAVSQLGLTSGSDARGVNNCVLRAGPFYFCQLE